MLTLYVSHIRPIMEYGSCVWNVGYLEDDRRLERLQRKWTREIDGLTGLDYVCRFKKIGSYSIKGRLLNIDLIQIWKAIHSDVDVGLSDIFEYPRNTHTRVHTYKLSIPLCQKEVKKRSFALRCVNIWISIPAETMASNNVETFKAQLDRFLGDSLYEISQKNSSSFSWGNLYCKCVNNL